MASKERQIKAAQRAERMAAAKAYMKAHYYDTTLQEMAVHLGVCTNTLWKWAKKWELGAKYLSRWRKVRIARIYPDGTEEQLQQLCDEMDISRDALDRIAHRLGVRRSADDMVRLQPTENNYPIKTKRI